MIDKATNEKRIEHLLNEFAAVVQNDSNAADFIYHALVSSGMKCQCGNPNLDHKPGTRVYRCHFCRKNFHFTAGTLFDGVARLGAWLGTIILLGNGVTVSAHKLSKLFDVAQATALNMHKRLLMVMSEQMPENSTSLLSTSFNAVIIRRSRETASDQHPVTDGMDSANSHESSSTQTHCDTTFGEAAMAELSEIEQQLVAELRDGPTELDHLCQRVAAPTGSILGALTILEMKGHVEALSFGRFRLQARQPAVVENEPESADQRFKEKALEIKRSVAHISEYFQGVSRKCLQIYLASYWNFVGSLKMTLGRMLELCLNHEPIRYYEIVALRSTKLVNV
jgi:transposase-like protein